MNFLTKPLRLQRGSILKMSKKLVQNLVLVLMDPFIFQQLLSTVSINYIFKQKMWSFCLRVY